MSNKDWLTEELEQKLLGPTLYEKKAMYAISVILARLEEKGFYTGEEIADIMDTIRDEEKLDIFCKTIGIGIRTDNGTEDRKIQES